MNAARPVSQLFKTLRRGREGAGVATDGAAHQRVYISCVMRVAITSLLDLSFIQLKLCARGGKELEEPLVVPPTSETVKKCR